MQSQSDKNETQVALATCIFCGKKIPLQDLVLADGGFMCKVNAYGEYSVRCTN